MEDIKTRILVNQECFCLNITRESAVARLLLGSEAEEHLFFLQEDNGNLIFCRMKLPNEITPDDFFRFTPEYFDKLIAEGRVTMF